MLRKSRQCSAQAPNAQEARHPPRQRHRQTTRMHGRSRRTRRCDSHLGLISEKSKRRDAKRRLQSFIAPKHLHCRAAWLELTRPAAGPRVHFCCTYTCTVLLYVLLHTAELYNTAVCTNGLTSLSRHPSPEASFDRPHTIAKKGACKPNQDLSV